MSEEKKCHCDTECIKLKEDQAALVFNSDGSLTIYLPNVPEDAPGDDETMANHASILASAIGIRLETDSEWGMELMDWFFAKIDEVEDE